MDGLIWIICYSMIMVDFFGYRPKQAKNRTLFFSLISGIYTIANLFLIILRPMLIILLVAGISRLSSRARSGPMSSFLIGVSFVVFVLLDGFMVFFGYENSDYFQPVMRLTLMFDNSDREIRKIKHDMKNHIYCIKELCEMKKYEELNPIEKDIVIVDNTITSTKKDKASHGFGILNINEAVAQYDGECRLLVEKQDEGRKEKIQL